MGSSINQQRFNLHLIVGVLFFMFLVNYILQDFEISSHFSRNYLDDLLAMPIILYVAQMSMRWLYRNKNLILDKTMIVFAFLMVSFAFEYILPDSVAHLTADGWDVLCYALGTFGFHVLNR